MEIIEKESSEISFDPVELLVLEARWNKGKLEKYVPPVKAFIRLQQKEISAELGPDASDDLRAQRLFKILLSNESLDIKLENDDQTKEIEKERWIRGEQGDHDHRRITADWIMKYAPSWRRWQTLIYAFIAVKCAVDIYDGLET